MIGGINQVPKNSFDGGHMAFLRVRLKSCTQTHTKHDIRSRCTKIKQRTNHGKVYLLIHILPKMIRMKIGGGGHRRLTTLGIFKLEPLEHVTGVLGLIDESAFS